MCGIAGYLSNEPFRNNGKMFRKLLLEIQHRGELATGVLWAKGNKIEMKKAPYKASVFLKYDIDIPNTVTTNIMVGHTRMPTGGNPEDNRENHPHVYGSWIVVHNGVLYNENDLYEDMKVKKVLECDSAVIPIVFQRYGFRKGLERLEGSFAIAAVNKQNPTRIYLAHSNSYSSPLYVGKADWGMVFSSMEQSVKKYSRSYFEASASKWYIYEKGKQVEADAFKELKVVPNYKGFYEGYANGKFGYYNWEDYYYKNYKKYGKKEDEKVASTVSNDGSVEYPYYEDEYDQYWKDDESGTYYGLRKAKALPPGKDKKENGKTVFC